MNSIKQTLPEATDEEVAKLEALFDDVACPYEPCGEWVCLQEPVLPDRTRGGVLLVNDTKEFDRVRNVVGRVMAIGPLAGMSLITEQHVPGWPHYPLGAFVRVSPHSHTRMDAEGSEGSKQPAYFRLVAWRDVMAVMSRAPEILRTLRQ